MQELCSPARTARSRRIRSRNRTHIPSRNPIRAAAQRCRIAVWPLLSVQQEKQQHRIRRAVPISRPVRQENRITAAMHKARRYGANPRSSAVPLCRLRTRQAHSQQQNIRLRLLLRDPVWQEIHLCHTAAHRQHPRQTVRQENGQLPIWQRLPVPRRPAIPLEMVRGRSNRAARRIRQRPVQQERSARPSADAIPIPCSRRRASPQMELPRSRSRIMFQPSNPTAWRSQATEPAWMAAPQIGSIPHPQRRDFRQHRLPTAKLLHPHARPRGLMRRVRRNSALRSAQFSHKAAAQKSRRRRVSHAPLLLHPPNGRAGNRLLQLLWAA